MLFQLIPLFGYLAGTALHTLIAALVTVRRQKRPGEKIFLILVIAVGIWHAGNFISLLLHRLSDREWLFWADLAKSIAFSGLATFPPLLLHTHVAFLHEEESESSSRKRKHNILLILFYLPLVFFSRPLLASVLSAGSDSFQSLTPYMLPFVCWFVTSLTISSWIDMRLARMQEDEPFRHFYRVIGYTFLFIALLTTFSYILGGREFAQLREYLELTSILASIIPSTVLAYFIYRYNFLELVIRRSFFVITLSVVIFGMYFLGVRHLSVILGSYFDIVPGLFEAISILALVVTFPVYKKWLQKRVNQIFFREFGYYHQLFNELEQTINRMLGVQPLVDYIQKTVSKILFLDSVHLTIFDIRPNETKILATTFTQIPQIASITKKMDEDKPGVLRLEDIKEEDVATELRNLGASILLPIRHKNTLMGIFSFKPRPPRRPILTQEMEMLQSLAAQTAMSVSSALLMEEKLQLEREVAQKEHLASIGQMAATLAHEIKNPLSSIKSITQSMQEQAEEGEIHEDLQVIIQEVDRLNHSVNQLLNFARSSSQDQGEVSLVLTMEHVIKILQNECKSQNVKIHHDYNGSLPGVFGSAFALQDIFLNLLLNALQAMPDGGDIHIAYEVEQHSVKLMISDSGPGIRPELISRIFDPFFTTRQKGTGLGLAVVKQKLLEYGADIRVKNLKPTGSQFTLSFPLEQSRERSDGTNPRERQHTTVS